MKVRTPASRVPLELGEGEVQSQDQRRCPRDLHSLSFRVAIDNSIDFIPLFRSISLSLSFARPAVQVRIISSFSTQRAKLRPALLGLATTNRTWDHSRLHAISSMLLYLFTHKAPLSSEGTQTQSPFHIRVVQDLSPECLPP